MFPGPFEIVRVRAGKGEQLIYTSLTFGYDTEEDALQACPEVAQEHRVPVDDLAVLKPTFYRDVAEDLVAAPGGKTAAPARSGRASPKSPKPKRAPKTRKR